MSEPQPARAPVAFRRKEPDRTRSASAALLPLTAQQQQKRARPRSAPSPASYSGHPSPARLAQSHNLVPALCLAVVGVAALLDAATTGECLVARAATAATAATRAAPNAVRVGVPPATADALFVTATPLPAPPTRDAPLTAAAAAAAPSPTATRPPPRAAPRCRHPRACSERTRATSPAPPKVPRGTLGDEAKALAHLREIMLREDGAREYNRRHLAGKFVVAPAIGTSRFSVRYEPYDAAEDSVRFDSLRALTRALNYPAEWTNLCKIVRRKSGTGLSGVDVLEDARGKLRASARHRWDIAALHGEWSTYATKGGDDRSRRHFEWVSSDGCHKFNPGCLRAVERFLSGWTPGATIARG